VNPPISHHQKFQKLLYVGIKTFICVAKTSTMFAVYATPTANATTTTTTLLK